MSRGHVISVCIFCLICATHTSCASHADVVHKYSTADGYETTYKDSKSSESLGTNVKNKFHGTHEKYNNDRTPKLLFKRNLNINLSNTSRIRNTIETRDISTDYYIKKIISKYSNESTLDFNQFMLLVKYLDETQIQSNRSSNSDNLLQNSCSKVPNSFDSLNKNLTIDSVMFKSLCPVIVHNIITNHNCSKQILSSVPSVSPTTTKENQSLVSVWLYSFLAVILISACGILGLAVIPIMQKKFYQQLLQFLVALAVGTLAGDALLHLLPHAMSRKQHSHEHGGHDHDHDSENMWKGFVAMLGLVFFFFMEKIITIAAKWRRRKQLKNKLPRRLKVLDNEGSTQLTNASEKQCKHKYSSFPYCYDEIKTADGSTEEQVFRLAGGTDSMESYNNTQTTTLEEIVDNPDDQSYKHPCLTNNHKLETNQNLIKEYSSEKMLSNPESNKMLERNKEDTDSIEYMVILREHENRHHGHSHTHGHVHSAPKNMSSVAWMVIMGDGLHNFTDGMAIGAAFAEGIGGGFSTAVAVFCHELPHELGDFAMLLKAGMTMKQALFYNLLSSVLCIFGNALGVWLGNVEYASSWIFSAAAGMFLYIALVDMIPELSSGHESEDSTLLQCCLHISGLLLGLGIMALIALYEHDLKNIFHKY